ncbi:nucleotide disphospho-sugar-binding domain-containing protein [Paenibacillus polymyxa]|uniref:nucleotide disphospho-sugar-binding domain-containing protein n=1 Tax=Paenibacillus polymyxa TaxID=1406 RepID=UPI00295AFEE4|nr:nucleotide disphospho-sugar-binding domain-containing protein [Paenibacillus polymyxa]
MNDNDPEIKKLYTATMQITHQLANELQVEAPAIEEIAPHGGRLRSVYTSRYFQPQAEKLDHSFIFTGPSIIPRKDAHSFPFEQLRVLHPQAVYISMGTILNKDLEFYKLCFAASLIFRNWKCQHVDAFVTHAGMNSISEALYYNVPQVMIPLTSDQPIVASRVQELGAGVVVDKNKLTPASLRAALLEVLSHPTYKEQAHEIGESLRQADGYRHAADTIMSHFSTIEK